MILRSSHLRAVDFIIDDSVHDKNQTENLEIG